jgi:hypothetical protein
MLAVVGVGVAGAADCEAAEVLSTLFVSLTVHAPIVSAVASIASRLMRNETRLMCFLLSVGLATEKARAVRRASVTCGLNRGPLELQRARAVRAGAT